MLVETIRRYRTALSPQFTILCRYPEGMPVGPDVQDSYGVELATSIADYFYPPRTRFWRSLFYRVPLLEDLWCFGRGAALLTQALLWRSRSSRVVEDRSLIGRLAHADLVHCYGGGFFQDAGRNFVSRPFCFTLWSALLLKRPVVITGQGVGPCTSPIDQWLIRKVFASAAVCSSREAGHDNALLEALCEAIPSIRRDGDDAVALPVRVTDLVRERIDRDLPRTSRPLVAFQCRLNEYTEASGTCEWIVQLIDSLIEELGVHILFVPMLDTEDCDDAAVALTLRERLSHSQHASVLPQGYSPGQTKAVLAECEAAVGLSYHFLLFALCGGVGSVGLYMNEYYRLKLGGLFAHFEEPGAMEFKADAIPHVIDRVRQLLCEDRERREERRQCARHMAERVERTFSEILALLPCEESLPEGSFDGNPSLFGDRQKERLG